MPEQNSTSMLSPNIKFIIRRLFSQKTHTIIHILGLTLGITTCLIIGLFLAYELSFDNYHDKADRIYRVNQVWEAPSYGADYNYTAPAPLGAALRENIPNIETVASVFPRDPKTIEVSPDKLFKEDRILFAESGILDVFDIEIISGNAKEALSQPWQTILSESTAKRYFGEEDPIGKTLTYDGEHTLTVAGVMKDLPDNFHLPASMLVSYLVETDYMGFNMKGWGFTFGASTYIVLKEGTEVSAVKGPIQGVYDKFANTDPDDPEISRADLQPLSEIHLEPKYNGGGSWIKAINTRWLWFFGSVGLIVLFLACINFINLSTAQSLMRSKEIAVRKTIGAGRQQLIIQFIGEALMIILIATALALVITHFILPYLNESLEKGLAFQYLINGKGLFILLGGLTLTGLLTGLYPAWLLSKFQPATALKGSNTSTDKSSNFLRKGLVIAQFTISGAMLIALFFISQQLNFFYTQNLGFDKDNIITVMAPDESKYPMLANELMKINAVKEVAFMGGPPSQLDHNSTEMKNYGDPNPYPVNILFGDNHFPALFDLKLLAGRYFEINDTSAASFSVPRDQRFPKVLVNEELVSVMGFGSPEEAVGKRFISDINSWKPEIVGVVENFVTNSLHDTIQSTIIMQHNGFYSEAAIKIEANSDISETLASIQTTWEKAFPRQYFDYEFLDDHIATFYKSESQLLSFSRIFAGLAILISCLGLWGLATHAAIQRTKEIGIRKVLGASILGIVKLMSKDFLKLVGISILLAIPFAWYFVNTWLQSFANRIDLNWWVFVLSGIMIVLIAFITISFQSIKSALVNPLECIRQE